MEVANTDRMVRWVDRTDRHSNLFLTTVHYDALSLASPARGYDAQPVALMLRPPAQRRLPPLAAGAPAVLAVQPATAATVVAPPTALPGRLPAPPPSWAACRSIAPPGAASLGKSTSRVIRPALARPTKRRLHKVKLATWRDSPASQVGQLNWNDLIVTVPEPTATPPQPPSLVKWGTVSSLWADDEGLGTSPIDTPRAFSLAEEPAEPAATTATPAAVAAAAMRGASPPGTEPAATTSTPAAVAAATMRGASPPGGTGHPGGTGMARNSPIPIAKIAPGTSLEDAAFSSSSNAPNDDAGELETEVKDRVFEAENIVKAVEEYHDRVAGVAERWNCSYADAAELCDSVDAAQSTRTSPAAPIAAVNFKKSSFFCRDPAASAPSNPAAAAARRAQMRSWLEGKVVYMAPDTTTTTNPGPVLGGDAEEGLDLDMMARNDVFYNTDEEGSCFSSEDDPFDFSGEEDFVGGEVCDGDYDEGVGIVDVFHAAAIFNHRHDRHDAGASCSSNEPPLPGLMPQFNHRGTIIHERNTGHRIVPDADARAQLLLSDSGFTAQCSSPAVTRAGSTSDGRGLCGQSFAEQLGTAFALYTKTQVDVGDGEAIARETVFGGVAMDSRDDVASKAMCQMKSRSMEEFDLCSRSRF